MVQDRAIVTTVDQYKAWSIEQRPFQ